MGASGVQTRVGNVQASQNVFMKNTSSEYKVYKPRNCVADLRTHLDILHPRLDSRAYVTTETLAHSIFLTRIGGTKLYMQSVTTLVEL